MFRHVLICVYCLIHCSPEFLGVREWGLLGGAWPCPSCLWPGVRTGMPKNNRRRGCLCRSELLGDKPSATVKGGLFQPFRSFESFSALKKPPPSPCLKTFKQANPFGNEVKRWGCVISSGTLGNLNLHVRVLELFPAREGVR